jgi:hypothetical protein
MLMACRTIPGKFFENRCFDFLHFIISELWNYAFLKLDHSDHESYMYVGLSKLSHDSFLW